MTIRIWYHGTGSGNVQSILKEGFRKGTWFAAHLEDALGFGGRVIFQVALDFPGRPRDADDWQVCCYNPIPSSAIVKISSYTEFAIADFPDRRQDVFEVNEKSVNAK